MIKKLSKNRWVNFIANKRQKYLLIHEIKVSFVQIISFEMFIIIFCIK